MRSAITPKRVAQLLLVFGLMGCSVVPTSGPSIKAIEESAAGAEEADPNAFAFHLIQVDDVVIEVLDGSRPMTLADVMRRHAGPPLRLIGVGDQVAVTIWEAARGGLFSASVSDDITPGGGAASITLPPQRVDRDGRISVPYAGFIKAVGRRPEEISRDIVRALDQKAIQPQALVTVTDSAVNQVTVLGDVIESGRIALKGQADRLLDVIAAAGNVSAPIYSVSVRLTRGGQSVDVPLHRVLSDPHENIVMQAGDVVTLFRNPETFTAFGATGVSTLASFDDEMLMLDEALAKVGGIIDARGDPAGVFVFRYEEREALDAMRPALEQIADVDPANRVAVAYQVDLRQPSGLFFARRFLMRNKDVLFVANADASELRKVLGLIGAVLSPASTGVSAGRLATR